jgi:hypothetical protein
MHRRRRHQRRRPNEQVDTTATAAIAPARQQRADSSRALTCRRDCSVCMQNARVSRGPSSRRVAMRSDDRVDALERLCGGALLAVNAHTELHHSHHECDCHSARPGTAARRERDAHRARRQPRPRDRRRRCARAARALSEISTNLVHKERASNATRTRNIRQRDVVLDDNHLNRKAHHSRALHCQCKVESIACVRFHNEHCAVLTRRHVTNRRQHGVTGGEANKSPHTAAVSSPSLTNPACATARGRCRRPRSGRRDRAASRRAPPRAETRPDAPKRAVRLEQ